MTESLKLPVGIESFEEIRCRKIKGVITWKQILITF